MADPVVAVLSASGVHLLAVVSPGPNFLVVSRTALAHSRGTAMWVTAGVTAGAAVIITSGFLGASAVFTRSEGLYDSLRLAGAAYLAYLGARALWGVWRSPSSASVGSRRGPSSPGEGAAFRLGLLTIASNAKAFVYLFVFFTSIIPPDLPWSARASLVVIMPTITFTWYSLIAWAFSGERMRGWYSTLRAPVEIVFGALLVFIGVEVALAV